MLIYYYSIIISKRILSMEIIKLNVGGRVFVTSKSTLMNSPWFEIFFSEKFQKPEMINGDEYFIDREPTIFRDILNYLRGGKNIPISYFGGKKRLDYFVYECKYFGIIIKEKWSGKNALVNKYSTNTYNSLTHIEGDYIYNYFLISKNKKIKNKTTIKIKIEKINKYVNC